MWRLMLALCTDFSQWGQVTCVPAGRPRRKSSVIACSDRCRAHLSCACQESPCSCKRRCSVDTAPWTLSPCAGFSRVWSDLTCGSTSHNIRKTQTCRSQARLEEKAFKFQSFICSDKRHELYARASSENPGSCKSPHNTDTSDWIQLCGDFWCGATSCFCGWTYHNRNTAQSWSLEEDKFRDHHVFARW